MTNVHDAGLAIETVAAQIFNVPLAEVLTDAKHGDHTHFELITVTIRLTDGSEGTGYTYTGGKGGRAILAMIEHDLAPFITGKNAADVEALYEAMQWHVHYVARGGVDLCDLGSGYCPVGPAGETVGPTTMGHGGRGVQNLWRLLWWD